MHLLPALGILLSLATQRLSAWPLAPLAYYVNVLPILACFAGSVVYHTLMANHAHYRRWLLIDVRPLKLTALLSTNMNVHS